jgi:two-component system, OmpR family, response regulator MprA
MAVEVSAMAAEGASETARHILVVDDDNRLRRLLQRYLTEHGYHVTTAADANEAKASLRNFAFDLMVLDVMLPGQNGISLTSELRHEADLPILLLTALGETDDRVNGLAAGADDYLVKPFALKELKARLRALLRRTEPQDQSDDVLRFADLSLDRTAWEAYRGERKLELSRTEFQLLALFLEHPRQVLTRSQIFERVWGYDFGSSSNSLGVYMGYLRRKTEEGGEPRLLHTVRGVGYVLRE